MNELMDVPLGGASSTPSIVEIQQINPERLSQDADFLVLGGTGFIGGTIVRHLVSAGKSVRVLCRSTSKVNRLPGSVGLAFGDLRDPVAIKDSLRGITTVIHCAAAMSGDWAEFYESTVQGTLNVLTAIENSQVERLVYISSLGVLDYNRLKDGDTVDESSPIESNPEDRGFYTRAKVEAEELVTRFAENHPQIRVIIIRPGLVYGSESNNNIQNCGIQLDRFLLVFGLGGRKLGLNYVENLAQAVLSAAEMDLPGGAIIHVVDPEQPSVREVVREHNRLSGEKIIPIYIPIFLWKSLFLILDTLLFFRYMKSGTFRYRFSSNAKTLNFSCDTALKLLGKFSIFNTNESFIRTYK